MVSVSRQTIAAIRFGYGFRPGEAPPRDAGDLLATLNPGAGFPAAPGPSMAERVGDYAEFARLRKKNRNDANRPAMMKIRKFVRNRFRRDIRERLLVPVFSPYGFYERLAWFWGDHFAVHGRALIGKSMAPLFETEAIRPFLAGPFRLLLRAAATHPAMVHYLDQDGSIGPDSPAGRKMKMGLNENLAREIIELHTLGVDAAYSQNDVRQFAELLTGLGFDRTDGEQLFRARRAEPGPETVLGVTYGGGAARMADIYRALDDLAAHPATARHIARKLAVHFVSDTPSEGLISHLEAAFRRTDGDLTAVYAALLDHDESWQEFGSKVRQPFDFFVASLRAVGPGDGIVQAIRRQKGGMPVVPLLRRLGQSPYDPPGPHGWPEAAEDWITPQGLAARIEWLSRLSRRAAPGFDPRDFVQGALGDAASKHTIFAAGAAAERWEGLALVMASPEFNRR